MLRNLFFTTLFCTCCLCLACTPQRIWLSTPQVQTMQSMSYTARLEPLKEGTDFFNWFRLTIVNKSEHNLEIDWNRSKYTFKGKDEGPFVFSGVNPDSVKNATIPGDVIPPGGTLARDIVPFKLIAFTPLREQSIKTDRHNIVAGLIPAGVNGIFLVLRQDGKVARTKLTVKIENPEAE